MTTYEFAADGLQRVLPTVFRSGPLALPPRFSRTERFADLVNKAVQWKPRAT